MLDTTHAGATSCALTLLTTDKSASKLYTALPDGRYTKVRDYDLGFLLRAERREIADFDALYTLLDEIRTRGNVVAVRGDLDQAYYAAKERDPNYRIARRKNGKGDGIPAHLLEVQRRWIMHDMDDYPLPPDADLAIDPVGIIDAAIRNVLPEEFHNARCIWQLSNSAGLVPGILKAHLFFWTDEPWDNAKLRKWIKLNSPHLDTAPFSANQPHFVCDPIIKDLDGRFAIDPLPARLGWRSGTHEVVALPPLVETPKHTGKRRSQHNIGRSATPGLFAGCIDECLAKLGDGTGLGGFHSVLLAAGMQYAIRCGKGGERDDVAYVAKLNAAINAAPTRESRDVSSYLDDGYHARVIDGAFRLVDRTNEPSKDAPVVEFPAGYGMTHAGLYHTPRDKDGNEQEPIWVCSPFQVVGQCASGEGEQWGLVLEWEDERGCEHRWIVDRALLHGEASVVCAQLEDKGLICNTTAQNPLKRCLVLVRPARHLTAVEKGGWQDGAFILANGETIGGSDVFMRSEVAKRDLGSGQHGSLIEWNHHIGRYCIGNSRLGMFVAAGFAGPLLDIINEPSGGVHLFGESQGKTTAAYVAASVWGKGARDGKISQWRSTSNGLEGVAARANDGFLVMDEISQSEAREAGETAYLIANGQGKQRADRYGSARPKQIWRNLFISTGELTLSQRMAETGKKTMTGMEVRLIDVQMDAGKGLGVFENLHGFEQAGACSDYLRDASATYYGTPIRAYLERLVALRSADPEGLADFVRTYREGFIASHVPAGADGQVRSVAGRFGVIAAAGEMAITFGALDWPDGEAGRACVRCFRDWLAARGTIGSGEAQKAIAQVRRFIELHGNSRFLEIRAGAPASDPLWQHQQAEAEDDHLYLAHVINQAGYKRYDP